MVISKFGNFLAKIFRSTVNEDTYMYARIRSLQNGRFALVDRSGKMIDGMTYSRARDARRGARRRELTLEQAVGA